MSFGQMAGAVPEPFEQVFYIRIDAVVRANLIDGLKGARLAFDCTLREAVDWIRDSTKPFAIPLGPYPVQEAERIASILRVHKLTVSLVDNNDPPPPPRTSWERLGDD